MKSCTTPAQVLKNVWKKTPHPSFNIVPSPVKVLEGWCRISDRRPSWHSCLKDPSPILNQGVGGLTTSATPVQDFGRQQYSGRCVFSRQPPKLVTQTTLTVLGNRLGWLFASLPTVSTPIPLSIRSAGTHPCTPPCKHDSHPQGTQATARHLPTCSRRPPSMQRLVSRAFTT